MVCCKVLFSHRRRGGARRQGERARDWFIVRPAAKGFAAGMPQRMGVPRHTGARRFFVLEAVCLQATPPQRSPSHGAASGHRCLLRDLHTCGGAFGIPPRARAPGACSHRSSHRGSARRLPCSLHPIAPQPPALARWPTHRHQTDHVLRPVMATHAMARPRLPWTPPACQALRTRHRIAASPSRKPPWN